MADHWCLNSHSKGNPGSSIRVFDLVLDAFKTSRVVAYAFYKNVSSLVTGKPGMHFSMGQKMCKFAQRRKRRKKGKEKVLPVWMDMKTMPRMRITAADFIFFWKRTWNWEKMMIKVTQKREKWRDSRKSSCSTKSNAEKGRFIYIFFCSLIGDPFEGFIWGEADYMNLMIQ